MKVINKYAILANVQTPSHNELILEFTRDDYFDSEEDMFVIHIFGNAVADMKNMIVAEHLHTATAIVEENKELVFYSGHIDESPDWGDWTSAFFITFNNYETFVRQKSFADWKNQFYFIVHDQIRTARFQNKIDDHFRDTVNDYSLYIIRQARLPESVRADLMDVFEDFKTLSDQQFYALVE